MYKKLLSYSLFALLLAVPAFAEEETTAEEPAVPAVEEATTESAAEGEAAESATTDTAEVKSESTADTPPAPAAEETKAAFDKQEFIKKLKAMDKTLKELQAKMDAEPTKKRSLIYRMELEKIMTAHKGSYREFKEYAKSGEAIGKANMDLFRKVQLRYGLANLDFTSIMLVKQAKEMSKDDLRQEVSKMFAAVDEYATIDKKGLQKIRISKAITITAAMTMYNIYRVFHGPDDEFENKLQEYLRKYMR